jgi:hypothetical protein
MSREFHCCSDCNKAYVRHVNAWSFLVPTKSAECEPGCRRSHGCRCCCACRPAKCVHRHVRMPESCWRCHITSSCSCITTTTVNVSCWHYGYASLQYKRTQLTTKANTSGPGQGGHRPTCVPEQQCLRQRAASHKTCCYCMHHYQQQPANHPCPFTHTQARSHTRPIHTCP